MIVLYNSGSNNFRSILMLQNELWPNQTPPWCYWYECKYLYCLGFLQSALYVYSHLGPNENDWLHACVWSCVCCCWIMAVAVTVIDPPWSRPGLYETFGPNRSSMSLLGLRGVNSVTNQTVSLRGPSTTFRCGHKFSSFQQYISKWLNGP